MSSSSQLIRIELIKGKGRSIISSKPLKSGQIILIDSPIITYSAKSINNNINININNKYCSNCYIIIILSNNNNNNNNNSIDNFNDTIVACGSCSALFCSVKCRTEASATCHTAWACNALRTLGGYGEWYRYPDEFQVPNGLGKEFCLETTTALLVKDKLNAFGLMEPFSPSREQSGEQRQRSVRAYGIYPNASLFNHDCLPNACRFDYIDQKNKASSSSKNNTDIVIRMIHDVPEGREICLSYFPVNLNYRERQLRLRDDYGFICTCDRCRVEGNWSDDEEDGVAMEEDDRDDESMEAGEELGEEEDGGNMIKEVVEQENDDFPHAYFFLRYMCTEQDCWGTLAPLPTPPSSNGTTMTMVMECNVCGKLKNDEQEVTDCQP